MKAKTPKSWTVKSRIFSAQTIRDSAYDFEQNTYSATPAVLYLCWQPVSASAPIEERGRVLSAGYQAVLYGPVGVRPGDLVQVEGIGWLEVDRAAVPTLSVVDSECHREEGTWWKQTLRLKS